MENIENLAKEISNLTLVQFQELLDVLNKKYNINFTENGAILEKYICPGDGDYYDNSDSVDEPYKVYLNGIGPSKVKVIAFVKDYFNINLFKAKDMVDLAYNKNKPLLLLETYEKEEAVNFIKEFEKETGGECVIKG